MNGGSIQCPAQQWLRPLTMQEAFKIKKRQFKKGDNIGETILVKTQRVSGKRTKILEAALKLFNQYGYHGVGIDRILAEAGVAKATLYRHFASKEDLIVAALQDLDDRSRKQVFEHVMQHSTDPRKRICALFEYLEMLTKQPDFFGCQFLRAAGEYTDTDHPIFKVANAHVVWVETLLENLLAALGIGNSSTVSRELNLLFQGATAIAFVKQEPSQAYFAKIGAKRILENV